MPGTGQKGGKMERPVVVAVEIDRQYRLLVLSNGEIGEYALVTFRTWNGYTYTVRESV